MWMNLYNFTHNSLGMHFWELPALLAGVITLVELIVHSYKQKKREKETQEMRNSLEVGDEIVTVGGIIGTVVSMREDHLVIETGSDRSKIRITRWAVQMNNTSHEKASSKSK